jgi:hypothetical protein
MGWEHNFRCGPVVSSRMRLEEPHDRSEASSARDGESSLRRFAKAAINQYRPPFSIAIIEKICNPALVPTSQSMQSADRSDGGHNAISAIPSVTSTALAGLVKS